MGYLRVILLVSGIVVEGICGAAAVQEFINERKRAKINDRLVELINRVDVWDAMQRDKESKKDEKEEQEA